MNRWSKLIGRTLIIMIWLVFISLPLLAFMLAARQEIKIGNSSSYLRFFLVSERDAEGIGVELSRPLASTPSCNETHISYLMWLGEPENVVYCECVDPQTGFALPPQPGSCGPP